MITQTSLEEICEKYKIKEEDVLRFYNLLKNAPIGSGVEKLHTAIYAVLRRDGRLTGEIREFLMPYVRTDLLKIINRSCSLCIDFERSFRKLIPTLYNLSDEEKTAFEEEFKKLVDQFKNKTLSYNAYALLAYHALQRIGKQEPIASYAEMLGIAKQSLRDLQKRLFEDKAIT